MLDVVKLGVVNVLWWMPIMSGVRIRKNRCEENLQQKLLAWKRAYNNLWGISTVIFEIWC